MRLSRPVALLGFALAAGVAAATFAPRDLMGQAGMSPEEQAKFNKMKPIMQEQARGLGVKCAFCHDTTAGYAGYKKDSAHKRSARKCKELFVDRLVDKKGHAPIDCATCHEGKSRFMPHEGD